MVPRIPSWTKGVAVAVLPVPPRPFVDKRCCSCSSPPCPSVALRQKVLQSPFVDKRCCSSAVLRVPPWPFVDKKCCSCSSPCPSVLRGPSWTKGVAVLQFSVSLRGSSWTKGVAVAVLRVPPRPFVDKRCCSCSSPWSLRGPSWTKGVAVAVLRVPPWPFVDKRCCSCSSPCPSVALRGQKVLQFCSSPCPSVALRGQKVLQLQFSVSLCGPSWTKGVAVAVLRVPPFPSWTKSVAVAVLRGPPWPFVDKRCCSCSSPCPSAWPFVDKRCCSCSSPWSSVALRGQKVLQLQFSVSLRVPSWTKGVAVAVLRVPPWPFVDKRCCSCSSPWSSVALRGQKVLQLQFSVSLKRCCSSAVLRVLPPFVDKRCCSSAVLRVPPWLFVDKRCCSCSSPCPSVDQKTVLPALSCILVDE